MRILVTGADGFVGRHLCRYLESQGDQVIALRGPGAGGEPGPLHADLTVSVEARTAVELAKPEGVLHLAGFSSVAKSHQDPSKAFSVNALGTVNLLSAVRDVVPQARVLLIGSGEMYGAVAAGTRAVESDALVPLSPYAASKVAAEIAALQFFRGYGLKVVSARPFNHLGPGQDPGFVVPSFAAQVAAIRRGQAEAKILTGNLEPIRDFSHVHDVVRAYRLLLVQGAPGASYNVCSGSGRTVRSLLDELLELAGVKATVQPDPARMRPAELPSLVGDPAKLEKLGWRREKTVTDALREVLKEHGA
jgi:GDP-4-dehydro-6-deoxy-D-mannose reductase